MRQTVGNTKTTATFKLSQHYDYLPILLERMNSIRKKKRKHTRMLFEKKDTFAMEVLNQQFSIRHALIQRYSSLDSHILRESIYFHADSLP